MIKQVLLVLLFLASGLTLSVSETESVSLLPHAAESFNVSYIQVQPTTSSHEPKYKTETLLLFLSLSLFSVSLVLFLYGEGFIFLFFS